MHEEVRQFIKSVRARYPKSFFRKKVLEVGSLNVNGSVREHFWFCDYLGIDLNKGRGVDMVCPAHLFTAPYKFDVVISTEMLEHDMFWSASLLQMYYNLKRDGLLIITCASDNRPEHGTRRTSPQDSPFTNDYYTNISVEAFEHILPPKLFTDYFLENRRDKEDLVFYGIKK